MFVEHGNGDVPTNPHNRPLLTHAPINPGTQAPDAGLQTLRILAWIILSCLGNPGLENISCIYAHGVPGKRPKRPLEVLRESGGCICHIYLSVPAIGFSAVQNELLGFCNILP